MAGVIGLRLIVSSLRSHRQAERWLGGGLLLTAGVGYMPMILAMVAKQTHPASAGLLDEITIGAWVLHNLGVLCMLAFIVQVFRAGSRWARVLAFAMAAMLWVGWGLYLHQGGVGGRPTSGYWIAFATIGAYPLWNAFESFRYHGLMRRRLALGLADPVVVDRFRLWGVASLCAMAAIWVVNIPYFVGAPVGTGSATAITSLCMVITAAFGIATVGGYWLTFFPPAWYRARLAGGAGAG